MSSIYHIDRNEISSWGQFTSLFRRELASYFYSPMSYIVWGVFIVTASYLFVTSLRDGAPSSLEGTFSQLAFLLVIVTPLTTMHLIAEELKQGSLEVLLADPVSESTIIWAKFVSAWTFTAVLLFPTIAYPIVLALIGQPDSGPIVAGYVGLLMLSCLFTAVGLASSSAVTNQIAAAAISFTILFLFWALGRAANAIDPGTIADVLSYASAFSRFSSFRRGVIDTRSLIYYMSLTALCLLLASRLLMLRRLK